MLQVFSNFDDLLFFSGAGNTVDSRRGPYELGSQVGIGWEEGKRSSPALEGCIWEATAQRWATDRAGGEAAPSCWDRKCVGWCGGEG